MPNSKPLWKSKTFWLAVLQAVAGGLTILLTQDPNLAAVGWLAIIKSTVDVALRSVTVMPLE